MARGSRKVLLENVRTDEPALSTRKMKLASRTGVVALAPTAHPPDWLPSSEFPSTTSPLELATSGVLTRNEVAHAPLWLMKVPSCAPTNATLVLSNLM